jgi:hypothetical protein
MTDLAPREDFKATPRDLKDSRDCPGGSVKNLCEALQTSLGAVAALCEASLAQTGSGEDPEDRRARFRDLLTLSRSLLLLIDDVLDPDGAVQ